MALFPPEPGGGKEIEHGYKGKGSLLHLITDKEGKPLGITTTSAKGNDSAALRMEMLRRGFLPIIGYRRNQKNHIPTEELYAFFKVSKRRWVVERTFSWLKVQKVVNALGAPT